MIERKRKREKCIEIDRETKRNEREGERKREWDKKTYIIKEKNREEEKRRNV